MNTPIIAKATAKKPKAIYNFYGRIRYVKKWNNTYKYYRFFNELEK